MSQVKLAILLLFYCLSISLQGQKDTTEEIRSLIDQNKFRFEKILKEETDSSRKGTDDLHKYYLIPETLPEWFFKPQTIASSQKFAIGISDPGLDSVKAFRIAETRAKAILSMSEGTQIENISDHYSVTREGSSKFDKGSQFLDFTKVSTEWTCGDNGFSVDHKFYTKYKEGIVLVSILPHSAEQNNRLVVTGELMQLLREDEINLENTVFCKFDITRRYELMPDDSIINVTYNLKSRGNKFNIVSTYNSDSLDFPDHPYRYFPSGDSLTKDTAVISHGFTVQNGLWNAYINLLLSKLNFYNRYLDSKVKSSYDNYSLKNQDLVRTVSRNLVSFQLEEIEISEQRMGIELHIVRKTE